MRLGIIGGSGALRLVQEPTAGRRDVSTPWGEPSAAVHAWTADGHQLFFLPRHGDDHTVPPHRVNYRANVWAMRELGAEHILGVNTVGGIGPEARPGSLVIPDQLIDYTWGRAHTYSDGESLPLAHVEFTAPYAPVLRESLLAAAAAAGVEVVGSGTYGAVQGPRLETAAEIDRLARDGCTVVGMTAMPEAALAREAGLSYAICCPVVNYAAGRGPAGEAIHGQISQFLEQGIGQVVMLVAALLQGHGT